MHARKLVLFPSLVAVAALAVVLSRSDAGARSPEGGAVGLARDERLAALEERLQRLEARAWSIADLRQQGFRVQRLGQDERTLVAWTAEALDEGTPAAERLRAFARLRGQVRDDTADARLPALDEMLDLARATDDPALRAEIYRALTGLTAPALVVPLLASLREDALAEVRIAAAQALGFLRAQDGVQAALSLALDQDPDEFVKDAAFEALSGQPRRSVAEREAG